MEMEMVIYSCTWGGGGSLATMEGTWVAEPGILMYESRKRILCPPRDALSACLVVWRPSGFDEAMVQRGATTLWLPRGKVATMVASWVLRGYAWLSHCRTLCQDLKFNFARDTDESNQA